MDPPSPLPSGGKGSAAPASNDEREVNDNNTASRRVRGLEDPQPPRTPGPSKKMPEYKDQCRRNGGNPNNEETNTTSSTIPFANSVHLVETSDALVVVAALPNDSVASDGQPQNHSAHNERDPNAPVPPVIPDGGIDNYDDQHEPLFPLSASNKSVQQPVATMPGTSNKHLVWAGALVVVVIVVAAAAVLIAIFVGQNDTASEYNASNSHSSSTPSTSPPVTMPPSTAGIVTQAPIIVPATSLPTAAPSGKVMANPAAVMITGLPFQDPATMAPSLCQSPDCVKNMLIPFLPDSTLTKLDQSGSCQNSTLEWIADSRLSLERIVQRYALAVLACEMKFPNDSTGFMENECEWLVTIATSDVYPCNGDGFVESLHWSGKQITATLPPELLILSNMTMIDFSDNRFYQKIPSELGNLTLLQDLLLSDNNLTGYMPNEICALSLKTLEVDCPEFDSATPRETGVNCSCCTSYCL